MSIFEHRVLKLQKIEKVFEMCRDLQWPLIANLLLNVIVKEFWKSVNSLWT